MAGAPKGNCNALKHGPYAKHYTPEQKEELRQMGYADLRHEMNVARMIVADMVKIHKQIMAGEQVDIEKLTKLDNAACNAIDKVSLCTTRYAILNGEDESLNDSLAEALEGLPLHEKDPLDEQK
jgi:uncharacterized protein YjcR